MTYLPDGFAVDGGSVPAATGLPDGFTTDAPADAMPTPLPSGNSMAQDAAQGFVHGAANAARFISDPLVRGANDVGLMSDATRNDILTNLNGYNQMFQQGAGKTLGGKAGDFAGSTAVTLPLMGVAGKAVGAAAGAASSIPAVGDALASAGSTASDLLNTNGATKVLGKALAGAGYGAAASTIANGGGEQSTGDAALGGAIGGGVLGGLGGAIGQGVRSALGTAISPGVSDLASRAVNDYGIPLRTSQISGSPAVKITDSVLSRLPGTGYTASNEAQRAAFTKAVGQTFGVDSDSLSPTVMQDAKDRIGGMFDSVANNTNITNTNQLVSDLQGVGDNARQVLSSNDVAPIQNQIDNIKSSINPDGVLTGTTYQALTKKGAPLDRAIQSMDPNTSFYAQQVRNTLDDALAQHASPEDLATLQSARLQYKNMKTVEPLVQKADANYQISPALLQGRVINSFDNSAYTGAGQLGDLAKIGQQFVKETPNSGTPERNWVLGLLAAPAKIAGGIAGIGAGRLASSALNNPAVVRGLLAAEPPPMPLTGLLSSGAVPGEVLGARSLLSDGASP